MASLLSALPPKADKYQPVPVCPLCAKSRHSHCSKELRYSITLSARVRDNSGTASPIASAAFMLTTKIELGRLLDR